LLYGARTFLTRKVRDRLPDPEMYYTLFS